MKQATSNITMTKPIQLGSRKNIIKKTVEFGLWTLGSRILGLVREILLVRFLGAEALADAFFTAYKIPNSLRKIFAEGALSTALIPTFVSLIKKESKEQVSKLMTLSFLLIEGILVLLCLLIFWQAEYVIRFIAPGWFLTNQDITATNNIFTNIISFIAPAWLASSAIIAQAHAAVQCLRILIAFIIFISCSALLAGALQAVNHFFTTSFSPILLNIINIVGLASCIYFKLSINSLCYCILLGGLAQFLLHVYMYARLQFNFQWWDKQTITDFYGVLAKFFPCMFAMSIMEINLFMSTTLATYLPTGSIALIYYANRFMGIPLGMFSVAFSTILLSHFSAIGTYAPKRLSFYLLEASKVIFWVTIPVTIIMSVLAEKIFVTLFLSQKFTMAHAHEASFILIAFLSGLFFFSLNKILLNVFYSLHDTKSPTLIALAVLCSNYLFAKITLPFMGVMGLVIAFVSANVVQTMILLLVLAKKFQFNIYVKPFIYFAQKAVMQIFFSVGCFLVAYYAITRIIIFSNSSSSIQFLLHGLGFWLWVVPLLGMTAVFLYASRSYFNVKLLLLD